MSFFRSRLLLAVLLVLASTAADDQLNECVTPPTTTTTTDEPDPPCNCDDLCGVIGLGNRESAQGVLQEDSDKDGDPTICASSREMKHRTFHSVCHMMCHNSCTTFRLFRMMRGDKKVSFIASYRNNFYKLHDGAC
ncbi:uncharacterized protein LOC131662779 [Phymastichus coffea]|uniref:uncharacterized protein LOC131662779 n=1 Tax=Phymastichus coffea TaxID=108790 RepID=UPI00273C4CB1|nr:uncharacterized protein LOC131662779 [Phymastichus coffea]